MSSSKNMFKHIDQYNLNSKINPFIDLSSFWLEQLNIIHPFTNEDVGLDIELSIFFQNSIHLVVGTHDITLDYSHPMVAPVICKRDKYMINNKFFRFKEIMILCRSPMTRYSQYIHLQS